MDERIESLVKKTVSGKMYVYPVKTEYDRCDLFLPPIKMSAKRVCEYIRNQEPLIVAESCFTGLINFDDSGVEGDIFGRNGHVNFGIACNNFYNKPVDNLLTFEWQHSVGDFAKIINGGIVSIKDEINKSIEKHKNDGVFLGGRDFLVEEDKTEHEVEAKDDNTTFIVSLDENGNEIVQGADESEYLEDEE